MCGPSTKGATEQVADDEALVDAAIAEFGLEPEVFQRLQEYGPIFSEKNAAVVNIIATRQRTGES